MLQGLIKDFPPVQHIDIDAALKQIESRFIGLSEFLPEFVKILLPSEFSSQFLGLTLGIHKFLFDKIVSNAGEYRKKTDPNNGVVYFGGEYARHSSGQKFHGTNPDFIYEELQQAFALLSDKDSNPLRTSILFYQKFVRIHPFYDANGRIARLIITIYLRYHGYYVQWAKLEQTKKNKFLDKLNECHEREDQYNFEQYFEYLYNFWKQFVIQKDELESF